MNENIQLVDLSSVGDSFDSELVKQEIKRRYDKLSKIYPDSSMKVYFKKHHENPKGGAKFQVKVSYDIPKKRFIFDKMQFSVMDALSEAFDAAEKEIKSYSQKMKDQMKNN